MTKIIAFSGRKQSGKSTGAEYVASLFEKDFCKIYSFADPLKQDICINLLGLTYDQCYGDDDAKNSLTNLRWENMPGVICLPNYVSCGNAAYDDINPKDIGLMEHETGFMTAREVMEYIGTGIFRKMKSDVWISKTINNIKLEKPDIALIPDVRFPDEIAGLFNMGEDYEISIIRLTRDPFTMMTAPECALDHNRYDWNNFSIIIDNKYITLEEKNTQIIEFLISNGIITR